MPLSDGAGHGNDDTSQSTITSKPLSANTARADGEGSAKEIFDIYRKLFPARLLPMANEGVWPAEITREEIATSLLATAYTSPMRIKTIIGKMLDELEQIAGQQIELLIDTVIRVEAGRNRVLVHCLLQHAPYRCKFEAQRGGLHALVIHAAKQQLLGEKDAAKSIAAICGAKEFGGPCNVALGDTMVDELLQIGAPLNVWAFSNLMDAHVNNDSLSDATRVLTQMEMAGVAPNVWIYNVLIKGMAKAERMDEAEDFVRQMERAPKRERLQPDITTWNTLLDGYAKAGQMTMAEAALGRMKDAGVYPNAPTFNALLDGYGKVGLMESAENVLIRIADHGVNPNVITFTALLDGYAKLERMEMAEAVLVRMQKADVEVSVWTWTALLGGYAKAGQVAAAKRVLARMQDAGMEPNDVTYAVLRSVRWCEDEQSKAEINEGEGDEEAAVK